MKQYMGTGTVTVTTGATTMTLSGAQIGGGIDLKLPTTAADSSIPSPPQTQLTSELPMDVDASGSDNFDLMKNIKKEDGGLATSTAITSCSNNSMFDLPMMQVDASGDATDSFNFHIGADPHSLGTDPHTLVTDPNTLGTDPGTSGLVVNDNLENPDQDLTWLDLVMPGSATGMTPVSSTPPSGLDGALGTTLGKEPFPFNLFDLNDVSTPTDLHHLEGDAWDNIPVNE